MLGLTSPNPTSVPSQNGALQHADKNHGIVLARALTVIECVGENGPQTLTQIRRRLNLPKSSVHRICSQLEALGWFRKRAADKAYVLSSSLEEVFSTAFFDLPECEHFYRLMDEIPGVDKFHVTLSMFSSRDSVSDVESTLPPSEWEASYPILSSSVGVAVLSQFSRSELDSFVKTHLQSASPSDAIQFNNSGLEADLKTAVAKGYVLDRLNARVSIPWTAPTGAPCAVSFQPKRQIGREISYFIDNPRTALKDVFRAFNVADRLPVFEGAN